MKVVLQIIQNCSMSLKNFKLAKEIRLEGVKHFPENIHMLVNEARYLVENNNVEKGIELYNKAIEIEPEKTELYIFLGKLYANIKHNGVTAKSFF